MAYCIAIQSELLISTCPLRKGQCYWQHRQNQTCCYTPDELTADEFAARVGTNTLNIEDAQAIAQEIRNQVNL